MDVFPISDEERAKALNHEVLQARLTASKRAVLEKAKDEEKLTEQACRSRREPRPQWNATRRCHRESRRPRRANRRNTPQQSAARKFLTESHPLSTWNCSRAASAPSSVILSSAKNCTRCFIPRRSGTQFVRLFSSARNASKSVLILALMRSSPNVPASMRCGSGSVASPDSASRRFPMRSSCRGVCAQRKRPHLRRCAAGDMGVPLETIKPLPTPPARVRRCGPSISVLKPCARSSRCRRSSPAARSFAGRADSASGASRFALPNFAASASQPRHRCFPPRQRSQRRRSVRRLPLRPRPGTPARLD